MTNLVFTVLKTACVFISGLLLAYGFYDTNELSVCIAWAVFFVLADVALEIIDRYARYRSKSKQEIEHLRTQIDEVRYDYTKVKDKHENLANEYTKLRHENKSLRDTLQYIHLVYIMGLKQADKSKILGEAIESSRIKVTKDREDSND